MLVEVGGASLRALVAAVVLGSSAAGLVTGHLVGAHSNAIAADAARRAVVVEQAVVASDDERTMSEMSRAARRQQSDDILAAQQQTVVDAADRAHRVVLAASTLVTSTAAPSLPAAPQLPVDQPLEPQLAAELPAQLPAELAGLGEALSQVQVAVAAKDATTALSVVGAMEQQVLAAAQAQAGNAAEQAATSLAVVPDDEHAAVVTDMVAQVQAAAASADVVGAAQAAVSASDAAAAVARAADAENARLAAAVAASPNGVEDGSWGDHDNGRIPADALARTGFELADPAPRRRGSRAGPPRRRLPGEVRSRHRRLRLLPVARGAAHDTGPAADAGRHAGHLEPRVGPGGGPRGWHRRRRLRPAPLDGRPRPRVRLGEPHLGGAGDAVRAVALGVRRLTPASPVRALPSTGLSC